jgi:hypothetical protein
MPRGAKMIIAAHIPIIGEMFPSLADFSAIVEIV